MLASTLAVLFPFRHDLSLVFRFWDAPFYLYLAKTLYRIPADHPFVAYNLPVTYFASHLPLFPILIRLGTILTLGNYQASMLVISISSSVISSVLFFRFLQQENLVQSPLWTGILYCLLPARWLLYHSVGATEPIFLCLVFASFLAYGADKPILVFIFVLLASVTRITGILLIPAFFLIYVLRRNFKGAAVMPLALLGIVCAFWFYSKRFGNFWVYFTWNAAQHKIIDPHPFAIFRLYASGINFHSTELYLGIYVLYAIGTLMLWKRQNLFIFCVIFLIFHMFVYHVDLSRYMIPLAPFALLVGFDSILSTRAVRWTLPLLIYLSYIYVWGWLPLNVCSVETYGKLLQILGG